MKKRIPVTQRLVWQQSKWSHSVFYLRWLGSHGLNGINGHTSWFDMGRAHLKMPVRTPFLPWPLGAGDHTSWESERFSPVGKNKLKYMVTSNAGYADFVKEKSERHQFCVSRCVSAPLPSITSMNLLRIAIFKRQPSVPPSDESVIILHLHDKCVCLRTHSCRLCMYECLNEH